MSAWGFDSQGWAGAQCAHEVGRNFKGCIVHFPLGAFAMSSHSHFSVEGPFSCPSYAVQEAAI